jgi:hypothetical protein
MQRPIFARINGIVKCNDGCILGYSQMDVITIGNWWTVGVIGDVPGNDGNHHWDFFG